MDYNKAQTQETLLKRFPKGEIPEYWRIGELKDILGYSDISGVRNFCRQNQIPYYRYSEKRGEKTKQSIVLKEDIKEKLLTQETGEELLGKYGGLRAAFLGMCIERYPHLIASRLEKSKENEYHQKLFHTYNLKSESTIFALHVRDMLKQLVKKRTRKYRIDIVPHDIDQLYCEIGVNRPAFMEALRNDEGLQEVVALVKIYVESDFEKICNMCERIDLELDT